jgi:adenosine kinase
LSEEEVLKRSEALIITRGEKGSSILLKSGRIDIPVVPEKHIADPTGVGDAYRGGLMKGLAAGASWEVAGRLGSVAATYALEHVGAQSHAYTWQDFVARYEQHFGPLQL